MRSKFKWIFTLLIALSMQFSFAQEKTITGVVSNQKGPLAAATVTVKGTKRNAQTDAEGRYSIKANTGDVLVFSYVGFKSVQNTVGSSSTLNAKFTEMEAEQLVEVFVTQGYRSVTKKAAVGANATVNSKTIENRPNANVMNTLQGQLAGVNITASSGQPGAKSSVVIRGVGTINGNTDPLYVIDGFPSNSDNFRSINANDIANVEVLKDASSIAEYGSRGSNGVIIIKTRKGSFGTAKTTFRYSSQFGTSDLQVPKYDFADARQLLTLEKRIGRGRGNTLSDAQIAAYNVDTDWINFFFRQATSVNHNFSVETNSKNLNSFTSASYFQQDGILKTTGLKRFTVRNNVSGRSDNEKFKFSINTSIGHSNNNEAILTGGAVNRNYILGAYLSAPYISPSEYQNPRQFFALYQGNANLVYTPLMLIDRLPTYQNLTEETRIDVATEMSYNITKDLTARSRTSAQLLSTRFAGGEHPVSFNAFLFEGQSGFRGIEDINQRREYLFNNLWQLDYEKQLGKHKFNLTANAEYNFSTVQSNNFRQRGLDEKTFVFNTGAGYLADNAANDFFVPQISASNLRNDLISYFGSFDYDYNNKYGFVASYRVDGTSRFIDPDLQTKGFWSLGGRWNIDEESFMDSVEFIDVLKLRGSIGTVGNQRIVDGTIFANINPPAFIDTYTPSNNAYNAGGGYTLNLGDPTLRWETTKTYNVGLDFEMKKGRIRGSFDVYNKETIDLFLSQPIGPITGGTTLSRNTDVRVFNKGAEVTLAYDIVKNQNTTITLRANGAYNRNTVENISLNGNSFFFPPASTVFINRNGGPINEFFAVPYLGVNPINGNLLFEDINGNVTENPTTADRRETGKNNVPVYQGGFGFDLEHKGFFLNTTFTFAKDVWRFDSDLENLIDPSNLGQFNVGADLLNAWSPTNVGSNIPSLTAGNYAASDLSDRFLRDASYIRLRNLQIGYNVPKKFLDKTFMKAVAFTIQGENLINFTKWQGYDPESTRNFDVQAYPTVRQVTLGVDLKF